MNVKKRHKRCCRCKQEKPISEFHKDRNSGDGLRPECKVCRCKIVRTWKANHPTYQADYRAAYPDRVRNYGNKKKRQEYLANYRSTHKDAAKETTRRWRAFHPDADNAIAHRRRAKKAGNGGSYTADEWKELCDRHNGRFLRCCRTDLPLTIDHVVPISKGGRNSIENIQPLCWPCNARKHTQIVDYRKTEKE